MRLKELCEILGSDSVFLFFAFVGTGGFVTQCVLDLIGFNGHGDLEDVSLGDAGRFKWFSKQAVAGFFMMFGCLGLTCKKQFGLSLPYAVLSALLGGAVSVVIMGYMFKSAQKLRSEGAVFQIQDAIGKEAIVYQRIPRSGSGKVTLSLYDLTYEIDAISENFEEIASFTSVQIIGKVNENTVLVIPNVCQNSVFKKD